MALTERTLQQFKEMLLSGELRPGQRLPPEKELGERLGVSRGSLRETVKALEMIRVLDVRRGDGTYVTELQAQELGEAIGYVLELHQSAATLEILEVRSVLEVEIAARSCGRIPAEALAAMQRDIDDVDASSIESLVEHDFRFHSTIAAYCGNDYLTSLLAGVSPRTARVRTWRGLEDADAIPRTLREHQSILDALGRGDVLGAQAAMRMHLGGVEQWLRSRTAAE